LAHLKLVVRFLRNNTSDLCGYLDGLGLSGACTVLRGIAYVTFAEWRWKKMHWICVSVGTALTILRQPLVLPCVREYLKQHNDSHERISLVFVLTSGRWLIELQFVVFFFSQNIFSKWKCGWILAGVIEKSLKVGKS
jgi:hypothetical protein